MAFNLGSLAVKLRLEAAQFHAGLGDANKRLAFFSSRAKLLGAAAGTAALVGVQQLTRRSVENADRMAKLAIRLRTNVDELSKMRHMAERSGIEFQTLTTAIQRLARRSSEAGAGSKELRKGLAELNIHAESFAALQAHEQVRVLAQAFEGVTNRGDRLRLAMKLLDTEGVAVLQAFEKGAKGIDQMREDAEKFNDVVTRELADIAEAATDADAKVDAAMRGMSNAITQIFTPAITEAKESFADFLASSTAALTASANRSSSIWGAITAFFGAKSEGPNPLLLAAAAFIKSEAQIEAAATRERKERERITEELKTQADLGQVRISEEEKLRLLRSDAKGFQAQALDARGVFVGQAASAPSRTREVRDPQLKETNKLLGYVVRNTEGQRTAALVFG